MRRYKEISNAYIGTEASLFLVEGKKDKSVNRYIRSHTSYIKSYLSERGVRLNVFETVSPTFFGRRSIKSILLRQFPTLTKEELELRAIELKKEKKRSHSKLYFIVSTTFNEQDECIADILCEDNFDNENSYKEQIFAFLDAVICSAIKNECFNKEFRLSSFRYRLPTTEKAETYVVEWDNSDFICDKLLADSLCEERGSIISPIHIDNEFNISLPLYPQITIKLEPLPKALYILFLCHPEGIFLKDIQEYETELKKIYRAISGRKNPSVIERVFRSVTNPIDNQLHRNLSIIRKCFMSKLNYDIAKNYIPGHNRAKAHNIPINVNLVEIPEII